MKRIFLSLALIAITSSALTFGATKAFFADSETSVANIFTAGAIDLLIDNESYYNGVFNANTSWSKNNLTIEKFFDFDDLKPGDYGEDTISIHVETNDSYMCADVTLTSNNENGCNEPEGHEDNTCANPGEGEGELAGLVNFIWWADDGDNVLEDDEEVISGPGPIGALPLDEPYQLTLADSETNIWNDGDVGGPVDGETTYYIGKAWCFGDITTNPLKQDDFGDLRAPDLDNNDDNEDGTPEDGGITCDGSLLGNESQTDSLTADVSFQAIQARHNPDFICEQTPRTTLTLVKEVLNGDATADEWILEADGPTLVFGISGTGNVTGVDVETGEYDLSEDGPNGYLASNWSCTGGTQVDGNTVAIAEGENVVCTVANYLTCDPAQSYATNVVASSQGLRNNGTPVNLDRSDPTKALGAPQSSGTPFDSPVVAGSFFSLGFNPDTNIVSPGGSIVVEFEDSYIVDGPGNDLRAWEITGGSSYPVERIKIEVSQNGSTWHEVASSLDRDAEADLASSGLAWARYVRVTDVSDRTDFEATADAYDLDAFSALNCAAVPVIN